MFTDVVQGAAIRDDWVKAIQLAAQWSKFLGSPQGNYQMYREQLTQRLYRQLRNDGMTKTEAVAAIELGTGDKPLPVNTGRTWNKVSNGEMERMRFPEYHQLKRRRF